jgi:hypothetical protein
MNYLVLIGVIFTMLIFLISQSHSGFAHIDPKHCHGYYVCYAIGYRDGYNNAQNGVSSAYACVGHSEIWCSGYNSGFCAGNSGSNIFYGSTLNIHGDNDKISVNQPELQSSSNFVRTEHITKLCDFVFNSGIRIK